MSDSIKQIDSCPADEGQVFRFKAMATLDIDCTLDVRGLTRELAEEFGKKHLLNLPGIQWYISYTDIKIPIAPDGDNDIEFELEMIDGKDIP